MNVIPFLEYLHERSASRELAESLSEVLMLRGHWALVPVEIAPGDCRRVAS